MSKYNLQREHKMWVRYRNESIFPHRIVNMVCISLVAKFVDAFCFQVVIRVIGWAPLSVIRLLFGVLLSINMLLWQLQWLQIFREKYGTP